MNDLVSICIPTYNQSKFLTDSVTSACEQTYSNIEIWVSDDASTDDTEIVMNHLCSNYPQIHYYRQPLNLGLSKNNNWLFQQPKSNFIVRLDSDDKLSKDYVEELMLILQEYPNAAYAHCAVQEIDQFSDNTRIRRLAGREIFQTSENALRAAVFGYRVAANICLFRTEVLQKAQYYRTDMSFCEDWDLSIRIADLGFGNCYSNSVLAYYRAWTDVSQIRSKRKESEIEGMIKLYENSLYPAFKRRIWDTHIIDKQRKKLAIRHSVSLSSPIFTKDEKEKLKNLLSQLGYSSKLKLKFKLMYWNLGFIFYAKDKFVVFFKDSIKSLLNMNN